MPPLMHRLAGAVFRRLVDPEARNSLRLAVALDDRDRPPREIDRFDARAVVVIAPHMDDEVAGVGGAIRRHVEHGAAVTVVFTTDGSRGCEHLPVGGSGMPEAPEERARCCAGIRRNESEAACRTLGVHDLVFLGGPDGALRPTPDLVDALAAVLKDRKPRIVYHPSVLDLHEDHWQTNGLLARCLAAGALGPGTVLRGYEVWTPLIANAVIDISDVFALKESAFEAFESQNSCVNYPRAFRGLNAYRSIHAASGQGYAEAFHETGADTFQHLMARATTRR